MTVQTIVADRPTLLEYINTFVEKRRAHVLPNYEHEHECRECGGVYLCPDRYTESRCVPTEAAKGWGGDGRRFTCSPCAGHYTLEERRAWYEAHGVGGRK